MTAKIKQPNKLGSTHISIIRMEGKELWQRAGFGLDAIPRVTPYLSYKDFFTIFTLFFLTYLIKLKTGFCNSQSQPSRAIALGEIPYLNPRLPILVIHNSRIGLL